MLAKPVINEQQINEQIVDEHQDDEQQRDQQQDQYIVEERTPLHETTQENIPMGAQHT